MRATPEWDESDLQALIDNAAQEASNLDFKRSPFLSKDNAGRLKLAKHVSALANADGGRLVTGIIEDNHFAVDRDEGLDPRVITKEWVDQTIADTIRPVPRTTIKQIWLSGDRTGRVAYVIDVAAAIGGAHQVIADSDFRYYRRRNFKAEPMEHYEVLEVMHRGVTPRLFLDRKIVARESIGDDLVVDVAFALGNRSAQPALYTSIHLIFDKDMGAICPDGFMETPTNLRLTNGHSKAGQRFHKNLAVPQNPPVYLEIIIDLARVRLRLAKGTQHPIAFVVATPGFRLQHAGAIEQGGPEGALFTLSESEGGPS